MAGKKAHPVAADAMRRDAPVARFGSSAGSALELMSSGGWTRCPVVNEGGVVLGRVRREGCAAADPSAPVESVMEEGPSTYRPDVPCAEIVERMKEGGFDLAFITDPDGHWLGLLSRADAEEALETS